MFMFLSYGGEPMSRIIACIFMLAFLASSSRSVQAQNVNFDKYKGRSQAVSRLRIASASVLPQKWDKQTNWERLEKMVRKAAQEGGADLVVTPEGALEGYVINEVNREEDPGKKTELKKQIFALGEPLEGPYIKKACSLAAELEIYLVLGFLERRERSLYNSAVLIDPEGDIIGKYSKTHFAQGYQVNPDFYKAGDDYPVFDTPFGKVGILICYDRQHPEPARILALKGAQVLLVPSYGSYTDREGWNTVLLRTRAYENGFPLVFCHPFQSILIDKNGEIKALGNSGEIVYYEIDTGPKNYEGRLENRRPGTYAPLVKEQAGK